MRLIKYCMVLSLYIGISQIIDNSLWSKDQLNETKVRMEQTGMYSLFPGGYLRTEWLGEYHSKEGRVFRRNTSYEQRFYVGSKFLNKTVDINCRFSFFKQPLTREVIFRDIHLLSSLTVLDTGFYIFKLKMKNVFPTSADRLRTKTILTANMDLLFSIKGRAGLLVPGISMWVSNEIYGRKRYQYTQGSKKVTQKNYDQNPEGVKRIEMNPAADVDLEVGVVLDYSNPKFKALFFEINLFDHRVWYSDGNSESNYYSEAFLRFDFNKRVYVYNYTRILFDRNFKLTEKKKGNFFLDEGPILSRVALGLQF